MLALQSPRPTFPSLTPESRLPPFPSPNFGHRRHGLGEVRLCCWIISAAISVLAFRLRASSIVFSWILALPQQSSLSLVQTSPVSCAKGLPSHVLPPLRTALLPQAYHSWEVPTFKALEKSDPASALLPNYLKADPARRGYDGGVNAKVTDLKVLSNDHDRLAACLNKSLKGKVILNLSGGADTLVPYACGETCFRYLRVASGPGGGWRQENDFVFDDRIFEGVGHEVTSEMAEAAVTFIGDVLAGKIVNAGGVKSTKI